MTQDRCLDIQGAIDIDAAYELREFAGLRSQMRTFGVQCLPDEVQAHRTTACFRCAIIPQIDSFSKNDLASEVRDTSQLSTARPLLWQLLASPTFREPQPVEIVSSGAPQVKSRSKRPAA
jgi:hypothetical protein